MNTKNKKERGFIQLIILLIIVLVIGQLLGYGPIDLWNKIFLPIFKIAWVIIIFIVNNLTIALKQIYNTIINNVPKN